MTNRKKRSRGIPDWNAKLDALCIFFGNPFSIPELACAILARDPKKKESYDQDHHNVAGMLPKYDKSNPTGDTGRMVLSGLTDRFRERWIERDLNPNLSDEEIRTLILWGDIDDFVTRLFPPGYARDLALGVSPTTLGSAGDGDSHDTSSSELILSTNNHRYSVSIPSQPHAFMESSMDIAMRVALKSKRVDQKYHYLTPRAEGNWRSVVNSGTYRQYEDCKMALIDLFKEETWRNFFRDGADGCVMLGCGAGSKDEFIIDSMLECSGDKPTASLHYELVDISPYMLRAARYRLAQSLQKKGQDSRVTVGSHEYDFVDGFTGAGAELCRPDRNVAWFLPGGTLGNLDENRFFNSLASESRSGDLVVVGAETISGGGTPIDREMLKRKYDIPQVRQFVEEPFQSLLRAANIAATPPIEVDVVPGETRPVNPYSEVRGAVTVEVAIDINRGKDKVGKKDLVALLTSTRYDEDELVAFVEQRQFKFVMSVTSSFNERYKQFVFHRK